MVHARFPRPQGLTTRLVRQGRSKPRAGLAKTAPMKQRRQFA
ncbi:hypothetical protein BF49_0343 [Bradyrhizobium sp.]|nr:hypothetical protein BF49_0343 [Bradyrhizobium sp.]